LAEGATSLAGQGAKLYADKLTGDMQEELERDREATMASLQDAEMPTLKEGEQATLDDFIQYMDDLQTAHDNNTKSLTDLKIRQEKRLRESMARYPKLTPLFQKAAQGTLGYNPLGAEMRAAEQELARSVQDTRPAMLRNIMEQGERAGVNQQLYYANRREYWRQTNQAVENTAKLMAGERMSDLALQEIGTQGLIQTGLLKEQMEGLRPMAWADIQGRMDDFYFAAGMTGNLSNEQIAERVQEAQRSGLFLQQQQMLMQEKMEFINEAYDKYFADAAFEVALPGGRTAEVAPVSREKFEAMLAPVLAQYDWAIENMGRPQALEHIKTMNELDQQRITGGMPMNVKKLGVYGKMFGPDNTYASYMLLGEMGTLANKVLHDFLIPELGGSRRPGQQVSPPLVTDDGAYDNSAVLNPTGQLPGPQDMGIYGYTEADMSVANDAYELIVTKNLMPWTKSINAWMEEDPQQATIVSGVTIRMLQKYGTMVLNNGEAGQFVPNRHTDMIYVNVMAQNEFQTVAQLGVRQNKFPPKVFASMRGVMLARATDDVMEMEADMRGALLNPEKKFRVADQYGMHRDFPVPDDFVRESFHTYIDVDIADDGTPSFSVNEQGKSVKNLSQFVVDRFNDYDPGTLRELGLMAKAWAHSYGHNNYGLAFRQMVLGQR
jgi:hypothetical protein